MAKPEMELDVRVRQVPKEYIILNAFSAWGLVKKVNEHLAKGYIPEGGVCKAWGGFFQALTKPAPCSED